MGEQDAVLRISAEIDEYKRILSKLPDITEKEARRAASRMAQQLAKGQIAAGKQAKRSAKQAGEAWKNAGEAGKQAAEAIGGQAGAAAGVVEKLGRSFNELSQTVGPIPAAMGAVSVGILGITLAAVGLAKGLVAVIDSAGEAVERLKEIEGTKPLPAAAIESLEAWDKAALGAEASAARLKVVVGAELADAFSDALPVMAEFADRLGEVVFVIGKVKALTDTLSPAIRTLQAAVSLGGTEMLRYNLALDGMADAGRAAAAGLRDAADGAEDFDGEMRAVLAHLDKMEKTKASEEAKKLAEETRAAAKAARDHAAAMRSDAAATAETTKQFDAFLSSVRKGRELGEAAEEERHAQKMANIVDEANALQIMFNDTLTAISNEQAADKTAAADKAAAVSSATSDATAVVTAAIGLASELAEQHMKAQAEVAAEARAEIGSLRDLRKEANEEQLRLNDNLLTDEQRLALEQQEAAAQLAKDRSGATQAEIDATKAEVEAKIAAEKEKRQAARTAGMKSFRASRQLGRAEVGISTAAAVIKAFASLGPVAGIPASIAAGLAGATQLAAINAQKPPQFHQGGSPAVPPSPSFTSSPDEQVATVLPKEAVLNERAAEALGPAGIASLNQSGAMSGGTTIVQTLDGRVISRSVQRGMDRGTISLGDRGGPVGIQDVFGAG
jgi:hypothetical protein